jgi:hypothetical protein
MASGLRVRREPAPCPILQSLAGVAVIASTWNAATSMAAAVPNISTDSTSREIFFFRTRIPWIPAKGPHLILTQFPHLR